MVTGVTVTILDEAGQLLEQGEAELWMDIWWDYSTASKGQIRVEARDLAGNVAQQELRPNSPFSCFWEKPVPRSRNHSDE